MVSDFLIRCLLYGCELAYCDMGEMNLVKYRLFTNINPWFLDEEE